MFRPVSSRLNPVLLEEQTLNFWKLHRIFAKAGQARQGSAEFVFYERPPTANSRPGVQHALGRAFQDVFPRYKAMRGYHVVRRGGWDTHGLPVEIEVEKQLGLTGKSQIEAYGIQRFNELCRRSAFEFIQDWERFSDRLGFWVDMQEAYVTYTNEYIESVWWILKTLWDRGLLYQGYKVAPYCPRCGTPLAEHEVAPGYRQVDDPSVYVRLPLADEPNTSLLVWTAAPWTLPGNVAVAAHPEVEYVTIERGLLEGGRERLILARPLLEKVFGDEHVRVIEAYKGKKLKGRRYKPLFTFLQADRPAYSVVLQEYVTVEEGSGLAHVAPAFGAEDLQAAVEYGLPVLMTVAGDGTFIPEVRPWSGKFAKDADPFIIRDLEARGLLFRSGVYRHAYPFCCHCETPLLYSARSTWYIRTSQLKERLLRLNQEINWLPGQIKSDGFGDGLEHNVDWALGRERYWGTPLPVWECETCHYQVVAGSAAELARLAGRDLRGLELHRPHVDQVRFPCPQCAAKANASRPQMFSKPLGSKTKKEKVEAEGMMRRVPELVDAWFDSGAMPVAQWHFPYENRDTFRAQFPADFVCEAAGQAFGWFYSLHAIAALLFDSVAYKNAVCLGPVRDGEGQQMSRSRGNVVDLWQVFNTHGADAFRWHLYTASPPGQEQRISVDRVGETVRNFTHTLWNVYAFFTACANLDRWTPSPRSPAVGHGARGEFLPPVETQNLASLPPGQNAPPSPDSGKGAGGEGTFLDRWLLSELHTLVRTVTEALDAYDVSGAALSIQAFVADLSQWYVRHSRRRFWEDAAGAGKDSAYAALYETLVTLSKLLAPAMPFLAEALYQNLVHGVQDGAPESVHLCDWPGYDVQQIDEVLNDEMRLVMRLAWLGHAARSQAGIKARQPLAEAAFATGKPEEARILEKHAGLLAGVLNVKRVRALTSTDRAVYQIQPEEVEGRFKARPGLALAAEGGCLAALHTGLTPDLAREGLACEFVHRVQELRKQAGLEIAERIRIYLKATPGLVEAVEAHGETILGETLAVGIAYAGPPAAATTVEAWFDGQWMKAGILSTQQE